MGADRNRNEHFTALVPLGGAAFEILVIVNRHLGSCQN
jgi:hypothetical protein